jgi:3-methyladenine DNA glycosylase AlkD
MPPKQRPSQQIQKIAQSLIQSLERKAKGPRKSALLQARYVGAQNHEQRKPNEQSQLIFWGLTTPEQRALSQKNFRLTENKMLHGLELVEQWQIWLLVFKQTKIYDLKSIALTWMSHTKLRQIRLKSAHDLHDLTDKIDNWAHSDSLSAMLAEILEQQPYHLEKHHKWNKSKNPWQRRQSIVSIYNYARLRKNHIPPKKALRLTEALLEDPHFYVQRAVGWTLREIDRIDPQLQRQFVEKNLEKIGATAWSATSERYPVALKKRLVRRRREIKAARLS